MMDFCNRKITKVINIKFSLVLFLTYVFFFSSAIHAAENKTSVLYTLGTNSGPFPNPDRAEASNVLTYDKEVIVIDAGDSVVWQLSKVDVSLNNINTVFLSHLHFDHTGGLFALLSQRYQINAKGILTIYGPEGTKQMVDGLIRAMAPVAEVRAKRLSKLNADPAQKIKVIELTDGSKVQTDNVKVTVSKNSHYILLEKKGDTKVRSLAFRFNLPDRSIVYTGDTGPSDDVIKLAKGADVLVTEILDAEESLRKLKRMAANSKPAVKKGTAKQFNLKSIKMHFKRQHLSPEEVGKMAKRAKVKTVIITHNAIPDKLLDEAKKRINKIYNGKVFFAKDLQSY